MHLDLDKVREQGLIDLNWGPQSEHAQLIADHINANGGVNGRSIEIIPLAFDPVDASSAQAACLQLTEDNEVFAVLGALRGDEVLCYTEQHDTDRHRQLRHDPGANRPEHRAVRIRQRRDASASSTSFVDEAVAAGLFDDRTVAVLSTDAIEVATDVAIPALNDAGVSVEFESLIQGDGTVGGAGAELAVNVESMRARGVDTVVVVGDATIPVNTFIGEGFFPTLFFTDQGSATTVAGRADLSVFDGVYTYGGPTPSDRFADPQFQEDCAAPWDEANPDRATQDPAVVPNGEPNHTVGLLIACRSLTVFTMTAEAAGPNLNNATLRQRSRSSVSSSSRARTGHRLGERQVRRGGRPPADRSTTPTPPTTSPTSSSSPADQFRVVSMLPFIAIDRARGRLRGSAGADRMQWRHIRRGRFHAHHRTGADRQRRLDDRHVAARVGLRWPDSRARDD